MEEVTMPAIPVLARIEAHLHDHELIAFNALLEHLIIAHYEGEGDTLIRAAKGDGDIADDMLLSVCHMHAAARRSMRERNMPEAA
jgi:hypothetical protein